MEASVIVVNRYSRSTADIGLSGVPNFLTGYSGLVAAKGHVRASSMEWCRDILQLDLVYLNPEILNTGLDNHA